MYLLGIGIGLGGEVWFLLMFVLVDIVMLVKVVVDVLIIYDVLFSYDDEIVSFGYYWVKLVLVGSGNMLWNV